jgi:hypothetical protein
MWVDVEIGVAEADRCSLLHQIWLKGTLLTGITEGVKRLSENWTFVLSSRKEQESPVDHHGPLIPH